MEYGQCMACAQSLIGYLVIAAHIDCGKTVPYHFLFNSGEINSSAVYPKFQKQPTVRALFLEFRDPLGY